MVSTLPPEVVIKLQEKLGKEEAIEFIKALDEAIKELSLQRKFELKEELAKELVTKADLREEVAKLRQEIARLDSQIAELRGEIGDLRGEIGGVKGQIAEVNARLSKLETYIKVLIALFLIAIALYSPVFFELVKLLFKP